jgi:hypothetical protein
MLCHTCFPWSQDELTTSASSSGNVSSHRLHSQAESKALNPHHHHRPPSPDHPILTLHCYKKDISILVTLPTTQLRLHFASFLARAPRHRSSTRCHCSLSPSSHAYCPSTRQHPRWRASRPSFTFWITYRHMNSHKYRIFRNPVVLCGVIN